MPIDPNVKFLGVTNQNIDLTERRSSKSNGYTDYFSLAEILAELTNDVGFITGNFYTADDSLTANRTVTGAGFSLKFTGQSEFGIVSSSNSILDTAFIVKKFGETDYLFKQFGNGEWRSRATKAGGIFDFDFRDIGNGTNDVIYTVPNGSIGAQYWQYNGSPIERRLNIGTSIWSQVYEQQVRSITTNAIQTIKNTIGEWVFDNDPTGTTTPETDVRAKFVASSGKTALKTVGKVNFNTIPTSNTGLSSGDLYIETAANILANGDLIVARKA